MTDSWIEELKVSETLGNGVSWLETCFQGKTPSRSLV